MARDNFSKRTVALLAMEVSQRCSRPTCRAATSAATSDSSDGVVLIGVAAHITAASEGAARYDETLTREQRRSPDNGIWLCADHAKEIDDDEERFTVELLHAWKKHAKDLARREVGRPIVADTTVPAMLRYSATKTDPVDLDAVRHFVWDFVEDVNAGQVWPDAEGYAVAMALHELALNAVTHGGAGFLTMKANGNRIRLVHDGDHFDVLSLLSHPKGAGGQRAISDLVRDHRDCVVLSSRAALGRQTVTLGALRQMGRNDNPCGVSERELNVNSLADIPKVADCAEVHVYLPRRQTYSDVTAWAWNLESLSQERPMVIHGLPAASPLRGYIAELLPNVRLS